MRYAMCFVCLFIGTWVFANPTLLKDGAFENTDVTASEWHAVDSVGGTVYEGSGHTGNKSLLGRSRNAAAIWQTSKIVVPANTRHRADGWMHVDKGSGWIELVSFDSKGINLGVWKSPTVQKGKDWTYIAVESPDTLGGIVPIALQIRFCVDGEATLDDVSLRDASPAQSANGSIEAPLDTKGRIPYWSEAPHDDIMGGVRKGSVKRSEVTPISGQASLNVSAEGDWFASFTIPYPIPAWSNIFEFRGSVRCGEGAKVAMGVLWMDDAQSLLSSTIGPFTSSNEIVQISSGHCPCPPNATIAKPVIIVAKEGTGSSATVSATVDELSFRTIPTTPRILVLTNQVGYEAGTPKSAIVLTSHYPLDSTRGEIHVRNVDGGKAMRMPLKPMGRMYGQDNADWGWYIWKADFGKLNKPGMYVADASIGEMKASSHPFRIGRDVLFTQTLPLDVDFFFVQRCGFEVPGWHAACHMDDATFKKDGVHRDLTGGWHSAGDYNKINWEYGDGGVMYALVNAAERDIKGSLQAFDRDKDGLSDILDEAWWGAKFIAKEQIEETGGIPSHIEQGPDRSTWMNWCPPEKTTDNIVGTRDDPVVILGDGHSPLAVGGLARLGKLLEARGTANDYVARAKRLWNYESVGGTSVPSPLLLISSIDLYLITNESQYIEYAQRNANAILGQGKPDGLLEGGYDNSGDISAAALAYFALKLPDDDLVPAIKTRLGKHLPLFVARSQNPFGLSPQKVGAGGFYFDPSSSLGMNYFQACQAWSAIMVYRITQQPEALAFGLDQLDFVMGKNPYDLCMFEGVGSVNPPRYHHRYITIPGHPRGAVPGAIPNGFVRVVSAHDRPGFDLSTGGRMYPSYRTSEPWLVHNVLYTLAVTALHDAVEEGQIRSR